MGAMGRATNNEAELRALDEGLNICVEKGLSKIYIEGDSQVVINWVMRSNFCSWKLNNWLPSIENKVRCIPEFQIAHIYREGNRASDWLANEGIRTGAEIICVDGMHSQKDLIDILVVDSEAHPREGIG
ncbi:hypothetical protein SUGI_0885920 [Cryptomeria japonica]|nr:hypothetical protein SUGI_0885920 [Cryptomeria japonica]